jgi:hypothetical protein
VARAHAKRRPVTATIVGWLFIIVGAVSTAAHCADFRTHRPTLNEVAWIAVLGAAAIFAGAFILRGRDWARWLALAWMATHVVISAFHLLHGLLIHSVLFLLIAFLLFSRESRKYFSAG